MATSILLVGCALLLAPSYLRLGLLHPVTITIVLWLGISLCLVLRPFNLVEPTPTVALVILAGLASLAAFPVALARTGSGQPPAGGPGGESSWRLGVHVWRLAGVSAALLAAVTYGLLGYRQAISAALGGIPFGQLDPKLVRWAELYGNVQTSSLATLAFGLAPLLGGMAVLGGLCHRWWWFLLLPATLALTMQSPSRTTTLSIAVGSIFFYLLLSQTAGDRLELRRGAQLSRRTLVGLSAAVVGLGLFYFAYVGQTLDKSSLTPGIVAAGWVPGALVQPLIYQMGGVSAFTVELTHPLGAAGPYGEFGRSIYAVIRIARAAGINVPKPAPFASYVDIPAPFNTYTAFGDTYFDLGAAGVIVLFLLLGLAIHFFSRWPWRGHPGAVWVLSATVTVLTATPLHMRLLDGDILIQIVGGWFLCAFVLVRRKRVEPPSQADPVPVAPAEEVAVPA